MNTLRRTLLPIILVLTASTAIAGNDDNFSREIYADDGFTLQFGPRSSYNAYNNGNHTVRSSSFTDEIYADDGFTLQWGPQSSDHSYTNGHNTVGTSKFAYDLYENDEFTL